MQQSHTFNEEERKELLGLARKAIKSKFEGKNITEKNTNPKFEEKRGVFVTLTKGGELRGCIGNIMPVKTIYDGVMDNAVNAAFNDPRFPPLTEEELGEVKIEISILTKPVRSTIEKVKKGDGVIIEYDGRSATFLPQVWEDLPEKEDFMSHLCMKAGLDADHWKKEPLNVEVYSVESFGE